MIETQIKYGMISVLQCALSALITCTKVFTKSFVNFAQQLGILPIVVMGARLLRTRQSIRTIPYSIGAEHPYQIKSYMEDVNNEYLGS